MPFLYDDANTGVFTRLGKLIKKINAYLATATTTYPADLKEIADLYEAADMTAQIAGLYGAYTGWQNFIVGKRQTLKSFADRTLLDRASVLDQLLVPTESIDAVLAALHQKMLDDTETVDRSTVTIGATTAGAGNSGNGTILTTKVLDGFTAPLQGGASHVKYNGLNSELAVPSETMSVDCIADSQRNGVAEGAENFSWRGGTAGQLLDWQTEGSGQGPPLTVANNKGPIADGNFENWGGTGNNTPSNWTLGTGSLAGTHIFREPAGANVYRGSFGLKMLGTGALATIQVEQALLPARLKARKMYNVSVRIKASGVPAAGNILVLFEGTGYTAASTEKIDIAAAAFPGSFTLYNFFISMPSVIPSDWKLVVKIGSTLSAGTSVYFDSLAFDEVIYHGGVGAVAVAGSSRFIVGDRFTFTVANDVAGVFQEFFRRAYRFQLPSSGAPSIADSLAT